MAATPLCAMPNEGRRQKHPLSLVIRRCRVSQHTEATRWNHLHKLAVCPPPLPSLAPGNSADATRPVGRGDRRRLHGRVLDTADHRFVAVWLWAPVCRFRIMRRLPILHSTGSVSLSPNPAASNHPVRPTLGKNPGDHPLRVAASHAGKAD